MPQSIWSALGMLLVVVAILFLAYVVTRWLGGTYGKNSAGGGTGRKFSAARARDGGSGRFRLVGQISLGRAERLVLARVGDRCFLLGVTEQHVTLLKELEGDEAREWLAEEESPAPMSFADALRDNLRKRK